MSVLAHATLRPSKAISQPLACAAIAVAHFFVRSRRVACCVWVILITILQKNACMQRCTVNLQYIDKPSFSTLAFVLSQYADLPCVAFCQICCESDSAMVPLLTCACTSPFSLPLGIIPKTGTHHFSLPPSPELGGFRNIYDLTIKRSYGRHTHTYIRIYAYTVRQYSHKQQNTKHNAKCSATIFHKHNAKEAA